MINETFFNVKYDTIIISAYPVLQFTVHDNETKTEFIGEITAYPDDFALYPHIKKCMLREDGHVVSYICASERQLNLHFIAYLNGIVKIEFEVQLFDKNAPINYEKMTSRLVPVTAMLNPDVDNYIQSGYICVERDDLYMHTSLKKLNITDYSPDVEIMWENIQHFPMLVALQIDSAVVNLSSMSSDSLLDITITNSTLSSLEGIQGFPKLAWLTLEGCNIPCDFVDVLRANTHNIHTIEIIQCTTLCDKGALCDIITDNGVLRNIEDYCEASGITFTY